MNSECLGGSGSAPSWRRSLHICPLLSLAVIWHRHVCDMVPSPHFHSFMPRLCFSLLMGLPFCSSSLPCPLLSVTKSAISNQIDEAFTNIFTMLFLRTFKGSLTYPVKSKTLVIESKAISREASHCLSCLVAYVPSSHSLTHIFTCFPAACTCLRPLNHSIHSA